MDVSLPTFRHSFTACPCGHGEHVGRGLQKPEPIACLECGVIAGSSILTVISIETAQTLALAPGSPVKYEGHILAIVKIEQVTKLWGRIVTEFVRVVMA